MIVRKRRRADRAVFETAAQALLDAGAERLNANVLDQELEPCPGARHPVAQVEPPDVDDGREDLDRALGRDEHAEVRGEPREGREPTAYQHAEARPPLAELADERDAVDLGRVAAPRAGGDRDLVLARQVRVLG